MKERANWFCYTGLDLTNDTLRGHFELDDRKFTEEIVFEGVGSLERDDVRAVAELWYLIAGLSYFKAGAARSVDLGATPISDAGRALFDAALLDGLGEFSVRNDLALDDVTIVGGASFRSIRSDLDPGRVLIPFGGGIDSVVTVASLQESLDQALFVVSPPSGRFVPLEATAQCTGLVVHRATRRLDPALLVGDESMFQGHVPVSAMITLLAVVAAVASGRGGVIMSNEHSASVPNLVWRDREVNHQWSKSWVAEKLMADAVAERIGPLPIVASALRDRSELWVAQQFAALTKYHATFRSCNRAFAQKLNRRATSWCGQCDKCLFINLVLAPFMDRAELSRVLGVEPLADAARHQQLRTLVGLGVHRKPFECVGDPSECGVALTALRENPAWRDEPNVADLVPLLDLDVTLQQLLEPQGVSRVPANWLR